MQNFVRMYECLLLYNATTAKSILSRLDNYVVETSEYDIDYNLFQNSMKLLWEYDITLILCIKSRVINCRCRCRLITMSTINTLYTYHSEPNREDHAYEVTIKN